MSKIPSLTTLLVLDLEATCWPKDPPKGQISEIIEIGICVYDVQAASISDPVSILIKPTCSAISQFCTDLTSLTQSDADKGIPFPEACQRLESEFLSRQRLWCSWGNYDRLALERQCNRLAIRYPMSADHLNVKTLHAITCKQKKASGLGKAVRSAGILFEGQAHRGHWDAYNVARVLQWLLSRRGQQHA